MGKAATVPAHLGRPPRARPARPRVKEITLSHLDGCRIAVLGGTGGIGWATVAALRAEGASVVATGRDPGRLDELRRTGSLTLALDLADPAAPATLSEAVERELGGLDGLVAATGGYGPIGPTRSIDLAALRTSVDENLFAILGCLQAVAPALDLSADPSVVLLSGGGATAPLPRYAAYSIAKVATARLTESIAREEPGWRINAVAPGFVSTRIHDATREAGPEVAGAMFEDTRRQTERAVPAERTAELIAFLMGPAAAGITGRLISAVWDPWAEEGGVRRLREHPSFGRLRRVDCQMFLDASD